MSEMTKANEMTAHMALLRCSISESAFSGERVFLFKLPCGSDYSGVSPVGYFRGPEHDWILPKVWAEPYGQMLGYLEVFVISINGRSATIRLPDNSVVEVDEALIPYREETERVTRYVPIGG